MIEALFPPRVHTATAEIRDDARLHPEEEPLAASMSEARRAEFASARVCARRALAPLGHSEAAIGRGERRMPLWPEGVVGALTHRDGWCAAAVGRAQDWLGIGLDAEPWKPLSRRALERISTDAEREALATLPCGPEHWGPVVFSAKECLYKALFPHTRIFLGFREAEIALEVEDPRAGRFVATLLQPASTDRLGARRLEGRFRFEAERGLALTGLAVPA